MLFTACVFYHQVHGSWLSFGLLFLTPELSMLGYLVNKKAGAACYNLVHTYTAPLTLLSILWLWGLSFASWICLIWCAHVGFDRLLGYGLKYESGFKDTHLQRV